MASRQSRPEGQQSADGGSNPGAGLSEDEIGHAYHERRERDPNDGEWLRRNRCRYLGKVFCQALARPGRVAAIVARAGSRWR